MAGRGRPRKNHVPDATSLSAEKTLATASWRTLSWRRGTKGALRARFTTQRIRVADEPPQRIGDMGQQHLPGEEAWLIANTAPMVSGSTSCRTFPQRPRFNGWPAQ